MIFYWRGPPASCWRTSWSPFSSSSTCTSPSSSRTTARPQRTSRSVQQKKREWCIKFRIPPPEGERNYFKTFWKAFQGAKGKKRVNKIEHFKKGTKKEALREKREMGSYKILFHRKYLWKLFKLGIILNMMIFCPFLFRPLSFRTIKISRDYTIFQITCVYKKNNKILGIV